VEDHDVGQAVGGSGSPSLEAVVVSANNVGKNVENVVANHGAGAAVGNTSAADTPTKGAKGDIGAPVGIAAEVDGHHGDAVDHRGGDGADDEEDGRCEQQEATEVVDETQETHFGWCFVVCWRGLCGVGVAAAGCC